MYKLDLGKVEGPDIKLPTSAGIIEKAREFQKNIRFIDCAKDFDSVDHKKLVENSSRDGNTSVNPWLIHDNVWQKPLEYCKVISLQLIKISEKNKNKNVVRN